MNTRTLENIKIILLLVLGAVLLYALIQALNPPHFWMQANEPLASSPPTPADVTLVSEPDLTLDLRTFEIEGRIGPMDFVATNPKLVPFVKQHKQAYQILHKGLQEGIKPFSDRDFKLTHVPKQLNGLTLLQTKMGHKGIVDDRFAITLSVASPADVFLAIDERALQTYEQFGPPLWMQDLVPIGEKIFTDDPLMQETESGYVVFKQHVPKGTLTLGPACMNPFKDAMYFAFFAKARNE